ncbi:MAG: hypothetical protein JWM84_1602, partial [Nocardioides sp.]|nr:hypothetical protein [Nocardioides sp.]
AYPPGAGRLTTVLACACFVLAAVLSVAAALRAT